MKVLKNSDLIKVQGGAFSLNAAFLNAASRAVSTILELGRTIGTSIRMAITRKTC